MKRELLEQRAQYGLYKKSHAAVMSHEISLLESNPAGVGLTVQTFGIAPLYAARA